MTSPRSYLRHGELVVVTSRDRIDLVHPQGTRRVTTTSPARWSDAMRRLTQPTSQSALNELLHGFDELAEIWDELVGTGLVLSSTDPTELTDAIQRSFEGNRAFHLMPAEARCEHLVVACTGSVVAGLVAPTLLSLAYSRFQKRLDVILTPSAQRFLTATLLESYGITTWTDAFGRRPGVPVPHVHLGRADCILVLPATASSLHRLCHGACNDLLSLTVAASTAPVVIAPAMNDAMWASPAVARNVDQLRRDGCYVIEPTLVFGAADFASGGEPMFGGHGTLWSGPASLMAVIRAVLCSPRSS